VPSLTPPVILITHNVTSLALPQLSPGNWLAAMAGEATLSVSQARRDCDTLAP
jgi:hypothetical protein